MTNDQARALRVGQLVIYDGVMNAVVRSIPTDGVTISLSGTYPVKIIKVPARHIELRK